MELYVLSYFLDKEATEFQYTFLCGKGLPCSAVNNSKSI